MKKDEAISLLHRISRKLGLPEVAGGPIASNIISRLEDLLAQEQRATALHDEVVELRAQLKEAATMPADLDAIATALAIADRDTDAFNGAKAALARLRAQAQEETRGAPAPGGDRCPACGFPWTRKPGQACPTADCNYVEPPAPHVPRGYMEEANCRECGRPMRDPVHIGLFGSQAPAPASPAALVWTKEKPKVDGWYCYRVFGERAWAVAEIRMFTGAPCWHSAERHAWVPITWDLEWAGPIPEPAAPEAGAPGTQTPDYKALYHDLLFQVGVKHPGESRHETALRYLRNAEKSDGHPRAHGEKEGGPA